MRRIGPVCVFVFVGIVPAFVLAQQGATGTPTVPIERGVVEISSARLYYELAGSGDPVVLIHGGWVDVRNWDEQFAVLARGHRVLRYDVRGHGQSSAPVEGVSYSDHEDLANLLDHLRIRNEHLVGFSMGSRIAVDYVLAYPERSRSLVVVGPVVSGYTSPQAEAFRSHNPRIGAVLKAQGHKAAVDYTVDVMFAGTGGDARTVSRIRAIVNDHSFWNYEHESPRRLMSANSRLAEVRIPMLVMTSERDVPYCQETADRLATVVSGAEKVVLSTAGHFMMLEQPEGFNRVLSDFLSRH